MYLQENCVLVTLRFGSLGTTRTGSKEGLTGASSKAVRVTKNLLSKCDELNAIKNHATGFRKLVADKIALPVFIDGEDGMKRRGFMGMESTFLLTSDSVPDFEAAWKKFLEERDNLVSVLVDRYEERVEEDADVLKEQYDRSDYPNIKTVASAFPAFSMYFSLNVPENIPEEFKEEKIADIRAALEQQGELIKYGMRAAFLEMLEIFSNQLGYDEKGNKRKLYDSRYNDVMEFIETFSRRNIMNDDDLRNIANNVRALFEDIDLEAVRKVTSIRDKVKTSVDSIITQVQSLITVEGERQFDLE